MEEKQAKEVIEYIKRNLEKGVSEADIKSSLIRAGWNEEAINRSFEDVRKQAGKNLQTAPAGHIGIPNPANKGKMPNKTNSAKYGFVFSFISSLIIFAGTLLNIYVIFFLAVPKATVLNLFGIDTGSLRTIIFLKSTVGMISTAAIAFLGTMVLFGAIKLKRGEKVKKMGKLIVLYSVIIFFSVSGILAPIASIAGIIGGLLGYKGK